MFIRLSVISVVFCLLANCSSDGVDDKTDTTSPVCVATADADACECDSYEAMLVSGTGADCKIVKKDQTACFELTNTCINNCVVEFYRKDLGDGTSLIVQALQGDITQGWEFDGQEGGSLSCPIILER